MLHYFQSKVLVNKLFKVVDSLSTSVLRTKVPYEEATEIISSRLALNLKSTAPSGTGGNVNTGFASFNVPKGKDLLRNARPGLTSVNQKVCFLEIGYNLIQVFYCIIRDCTSSKRHTSMIGLDPILDPIALVTIFSSALNASVCINVGCCHSCY